jgi:transposase
MNYVGIDISKSSFDVAIEKDNRYHYYKFSNDKAGFKELLKAINVTDPWCVMEASGPYYLRLAWYLREQGIDVSVVNPLVIRRFCQMRLIRAKTDKKDAAMIAEYGKTERPKAWKEEDAYVMELKQMQAYVDILEKTRTGLINQLEAFDQSPISSVTVRKGLVKMIGQAEKQMKETEKQMDAIVTKYHGEMMAQVKSVPGIGKKTGLLLVVVSGGFTKFENAKQLSSYLGLSPRIFLSGTSVKGKARICKMGMSRVRAMLYVCSWSAIKCNKACKELYQRLVAKGKSKRLALIAVANKLLKQVFAVATKGILYDENYLQKTCF